MCVCACVMCAVVCLLLRVKLLELLLILKFSYSDAVDKRIPFMDHTDVRFVQCMLSFNVSNLKYFCAAMLLRQSGRGVAVSISRRQNMIPLL